MSVEYNYKTVDSFSITRLLEIGLQLPGVTKEHIDETVADSLKTIEIEGKELPLDFIDPTGIQLKNISISGVNNTALDMVPVYTEISNNLSTNIRGKGILEFRSYFEEKESSQPPEGSDCVYVKDVDGRHYFCYASNGSKISLDVGYRLRFFQELIQFLDLPIKIDVKDDGFYLTHSMGAELKVGNPFTSKNSNYFMCEMPDSSVETLLDNSRRTLEKFSSGKVFSHDWHVYKVPPGFDEDISEIGSDLYSLVVNNKLTADKYMFDMALHLEELSGLESLRNWCADNGDIYSPICYFDTDEGGTGKCNAIGDAEGYKIELSFNQPTEIKNIERLLSIKLKDVSEF